MNRVLVAIACSIGLPGIALAATRTYETGAFESISVSAGIDADIVQGPTRSVIAETHDEGFEELEITVDGKTLRIGRPRRNWFANWFAWIRPDYKVHVVTPALRVLSVSSGADVSVKGSFKGDVTVSASSGSDVDIEGITADNVKVSISSGSDVNIGGSCTSLAAEASSGSDLNARELQCESVRVQTSSGSDVWVAATKSVTGSASSGSDVLVRGKPLLVQVETSSGADVTVRE